MKEHIHSGLNNRSFSLRLIALLLCALFFTALFPSLAFAEGIDVSVSADKTSASKGDSITVTVTVKGSKLGAAQGTYSYDPSVLTFISGSGGAGDGTISMLSSEKGGSDSLTCVISFKVTGGGTSLVNISVDQAFEYSGLSLGSADSAVSIEVPVPTPAGSDEPGGASKPDVSLTGIPAVNVAGTEAQMYIWRSLSSLTLPAGYADRQVMYNGEAVGGAAITDTEFPILLYMSEADGSNARYYIYEEENDGILYPFYTVNNVSASFTFMRYYGNEIPAGYAETTFELGGRDVPGWTADGGESGVYLIYARSSDGEKSFYLYNLEDKSVQRYMAPVIAEAAEPSPEPTPQPTAEPAAADPANASNISLRPLYFYLLVGGAAAFVLLLIAVVVIYVIRSVQRSNALKSSRRHGRRTDRDADSE